MSELITLLSIFLALIIGLLVWYINWQSYRVLRLAKQSQAYHPRIAIVIWLSAQNHDLANLELTIKSIQRLNYQQLDRVLIMIDQGIYRSGVKKLVKTLGIEVVVAKPDCRRKLEVVLTKLSSAKLIINLEPGSTLNSKSLRASLSNFRDRQLSALSLMHYGRLNNSLKISMTRQIAVLNRLFIHSTSTDLSITTNGLIYRLSRATNGRTHSIDAKGPYQFIEVQNEKLSNLSPLLVAVGLIYILFIVLNLISKSTEIGSTMAIAAGFAIALGLNLSDRQPLTGIGEFISQCLTTPYALIILPFVKTQQLSRKLANGFKHLRKQSRLTN